MNRYYSLFTTASLGCPGHVLKDKFPRNPINHRKILDSVWYGSSLIVFQFIFFVKESITFPSFYKLLFFFSQRFLNISQTMDRSIVMVREPTDLRWQHSFLKYDSSMALYAQGHKTVIYSQGYK